MPLPNKNIMGHIVFLDRDGVINIDSPDYIKNEAEFKFIPQSPEAIALLCKNNFQVFVITNQSLIGRKMINLNTLNTIFEKMRAGIKKAGGNIKDIFFCPHIPEDNCSCRKPNPGLILEAKKKYTLNLDQSFMVGDSVKDIECAKNAGCAKALLVKTGNGLKAQQQLFQKGIIPDFIGSNLYETALWIINSVKR
ncbi:D-glycero-beta-D-manno-heptose 1,7-bisphosphate 7-phosphatase [Desulfobacula sp.]